MASKQTRLIALLLAASLFINTALLPVKATEVEEPTVSTEVPAPTETPTEIPAEAPTQAPTEQTEAPSSVTEAPTVETEAPTVETEAPSEETEASSEETEAPTVETEAPTDETEAPTDETEAPTDETEAPTDETEETEESVPPVDEAALLAAQEFGFLRAMEYYCSMPITGRIMPLEWWYAITGRISMREPDYSVLEDPEHAAQVVENLLTTEDWSLFLSFPEVISIGSQADLILLSYAHPLTYQGSTILLSANSGLEFDLTASISVNGHSLSYQGLGALDAPFAGIIRFAESSTAITFVLGSPLFNCLSTKAQFLNPSNQSNPDDSQKQSHLCF